MFDSLAAFASKSYRLQERARGIGDKDNAAAQCFEGNLGEGGGKLASFWRGNGGLRSKNEKTSVCQGSKCGKSRNLNFD